jgi:coatomer subunit beta'
MYLLGYIARDNRIYLCDKDQSIYSYSLPVSVIEYQTAVLRGDLDAAAKILPSVPDEQRNKIARFLESQDLKEQALSVSTDYDHKFDLAIQLDRLDIAHEIAVTVDREEKWKIVGDAALARWDFAMSEACLKKAEDLEGLLLMYQAMGNKEGINGLAVLAGKKGKNNVAFLCHLVLGQVEQCIEILVASERFAEAAIMARTYIPSEMTRLVGLWKDSLTRAGKVKMANVIADPVSHEDMFEDMSYGVFAEGMFKVNREKGCVPASDYVQWKESFEWDIVGELKVRYPGGVEGVKSDKHSKRPTSGKACEEGVSASPPRGSVSPALSSVSPPRATLPPPVVDAPLIDFEPVAVVKEVQYELPPAVRSSVASNGDAQFKHPEAADAFNESNPFADDMSGVSLIKFINYRWEMRTCRVT